MVSFTNFFLSAESESLLEKFAVWYQNSVFYELLNYFKEQYFTVEFGAYENFSVGTGASSVAQNLILAIIVGVILATGMAVYTRSVLGGFVRALLKSGANSTENAKKLSELGYFRSAAIRYELSRGVTLRKVIRCTQEDAFLAEEAAKAEAAVEPEQTVEFPATEPEQADEEEAEVSGEQDEPDEEENPAVHRIDFGRLQFGRDYEIK